VSNLKSVALTVLELLAFNEVAPIILHVSILYPLSVRKQHKSGEEALIASHSLVHLLV